MWLNDGQKTPTASMEKRRHCVVVSSVTAVQCTATAKHGTTVVIVVWRKNNLCNSCEPKTSDIKQNLRWEQGHGCLLTCSHQWQTRVFQDLLHLCERSIIKLPESSVRRPSLSFASGCFSSIGQGLFLCTEAVVNHLHCSKDQAVVGECVLPVKGHFVLSI